MLDLFWLPFSGYPDLAVLFWVSHSCCLFLSVLAALFGLYSPSVWLSNLNRPNLIVLCWQLFSGSLVLAAQSWQSFPGSHVLASSSAGSVLAHSGCLILAPQLLLSRFRALF
jgi:hypothetical protein